jgi:hypothetical protein
LIACGPDPDASLPASDPVLATSVSRLRCESTSSRRTDVYFEKQGEWRNLTRFDRPQKIYDFALSPDESWIFVWHMTRSPRLLSIYDSATLKRIACFAPGYGGEISWAPGNVLLHRWGAGTSVFCYAVYAPDGRTLMSGNAPSVEQSPSGRFLAMILYDEPDWAIEVLDLLRIKSTGVRRISSLDFSWEMTWTSKEDLVLRFRTPTDLECSVTLKREEFLGN